MKIIYSDIKDNLLHIKEDKRNDVWNWGIDNARPSTLEYLLSSSPTAKICVDKVAKAIYGKGVKDGSIIVNKKGHTLNDVVRTLSREYAKHNNAFLSIQYNGLYEISSIEVVPTKYMRLGKSDDLGYSGKFVMYNNWDRILGTGVDKKEFITLDRYNPNKEVVAAQVEAATGLSKYRGQIVHIQKYLNEIYSLSDAEAVENQMIAEIQAAIFMAKGAAEGFVGTKLIVVKPFADDDSRRAFLNRMDSVKGANNAHSTIVVESNSIDGELAEQILVQDLTSEYNDGLFLNTEASSAAAIIKAFNIPPILVSPTDSGLFGNSGELIRSAKEMLWEEREEERDKIEEILTRLMQEFKEPITEPIKIINPHEREDVAPLEAPVEEEEIIEENTEEESDDTSTGTE